MSISSEDGTKGCFSLFVYNKLHHIELAKRKNKIKKEIMGAKIK